MTTRESGDARGLRIGELADLAGTTTRAVRHYHALGLLPEPERDASGYRRYGPADVVRLVRIRRLRGLGLPLERVAAGLAPGGNADLPGAARALADELAAEIGRLEALRSRLLELGAGGAGDPVETWAETLRRGGVLGHGAELPERERAAAELLDALHPGGIDGAAAQAAPLLADPSVVRRLAPLLERFGGLAADDEADRLADEIAAALPRVPAAGPAVDVETMDRLIGHRLSPAQRRCVLRVRSLLDERTG
jgi:DNA-binding transcriptional MerR regulator